MSHPMQPLVRANDGIVRFRHNQIVADMLTHCQRTGLDLNDIAQRDYPPEDRRQLAQLIGYSLSGYHELSYVRDVDALEATKAARAAGIEAQGCRDTGCPIHCDGEDGK